MNIFKKVLPMLCKECKNAYRQNGSSRCEECAKKHRVSEFNKKTLSK